MTPQVPEGWLEIDKHYSLELCFSIEKQPETVWRGGCLALGTADLDILIRS